ncbi:MAG TPA: branched-chain amino acid ABC transporter permease [Gaiellaceae bacterium]|nr:branched-chain amino acid ABC transporter permease [Gaiellaceae bacterium]
MTLADTTLFLQDLINALSLGGLYALVALGVALIFGVMGFINFAHGELIMVGGYVLLYVVSQNHAVAILATVGAVVVAALLMERVAFRPVRNADPTTLLITSFAVSYLIQNIAFLTVGSVGKFVAIPAGVSDSVSIGGVDVTKIAIAQFSVTIVLLVLLWLFMKNTLIGVQMRAAAEDFGMARFLGVPGNRVIAYAFGLSGLLAGVVSVLYIAQTTAVTPTVGLAPALVGFVATVIGGMRSLVGAVIGGFFLGILSVALDSYLPGNLELYRDAFIYGAVIALLILRPQGLFGGRGGVRV